MIHFKNVSKVFDKNQLLALDHINLSIDELNIFGFIGKSGAGKSTLLRMINGLETPTTGEVIVNEHSIHSLPSKELNKIRHSIGMIFQNFNLIHSKTVYKNIAYPLEIQGIAEQIIQKKVKDVLEIVGLSSKINDYPSQLSGGEKQRIAIARSIINDPKILLCDEPTSALDPETTQRILKLLKRINHNLGITIVLITHELKVIQSICTHVGVLDAGKLVEYGRTDSIFSLKNAHPKTKELLVVEECIN